MVRNIAISVLVCQPICLFVCLFARIFQRPPIHFHESFCTCYLWLWPRSPLTTVQQFMYFRFS